MCDIIAAGLPRLGGPGELVYAPKGIGVHVGGHSANMAIDLAQLGQKGVAVAGCVGEDVLGAFIESELRGRGLEAYVERSRESHTAKNLAIVVVGEDRRFYAELAANTMLSPEHVLMALEETRPGVFYQGTVGGLRHVDRRLDEVLERAGRLGCMTFVDAVMPQDEGWGKLLGSLRLIDILHCNDLESRALTGEGDPSAASESLLDRGVGLSLITMGERGVMAAVGGLRIALPPFTVEAIDPTGAGDAFCAGIVHAILQAGLRREDLAHVNPETLRYVLLEGAAAGAACVTAVGATKAVTREAVDGLIRDQADSVWAGASVRAPRYRCCPA